MKRSYSVAALAVLVVMALLMTSFGASSSTNVLSSVKSGSYPTNYGLPQNNTLFNNFTQELLITGNIAAVAIGDLNNDNRPDIAVGFSDRNGVSIFYQSTQGYYSGAPSKSIPTTNRILSLACADCNRDGMNDLVIGNGTRLNVYLQNDGFSKNYPIFTFVNQRIIHGIVASDFDKDNKMDFAVISYKNITGIEKPQMTVIYQDTNTFLPYTPVFYTTGTIDLPSMTKPKMAVGDINNNGLDDIVLTDEINNTLAGYINVNDPDLNWYPVSQRTVQGPVDLFVGNIGGVGNITAVAAKGSSQVRLYNYLAGSNEFNATGAIFERNGVRLVTGIDFDKNTRIDIAEISNTSNNASIYLSQYPFQYAFPTTAFPILGNPIFARSTDFNNDGKQDLLVASNGTAGISAFVIYYRTSATMSNANDNIIINGKNPDSIVLGSFDGTTTKILAILNRSSNTITFTDKNMNQIAMLSVAKTLLKICEDDLTHTAFDDLITLEKDGRNVTVHWGNTNFYSGTDQKLVLTTDISNPSSIATGDLLGDSGNEIAVGLTNGIEIFKNIGPVHFVSTSNYTLRLPSTKVTSLCLGDFDVNYEKINALQQTNDIAIVNTTSNSIQILYNTGIGASPFLSDAGYHHKSIPVDLSGYAAIRWIASGNIDGDPNNMSDIAVGLADGKVIVFPQLTSFYPESFDFDHMALIQLNYGSDQGALGDLNDDGLQEIAVSSDKSGQVSVVQYSESGLKAIANKTVGAGNIIPLCGDLNGDGYTDLIAAATRSYSTSVYYQNDLAPVAIITPPASPYEGVKVIFDASSSTDSKSDLSTLNYTWTFDNQTTTWGKVVEHTFILNKTHNYTLTVTDRGGLSDTAYGRIIVKDTIPRAGFTILPISPVQGHPVQFSDNSSSDTNTINEWHWDFGDGTTSTEQNPVHTYNFNHSYSVSLRVVEIDGSTNTSGIQVVNVKLGSPTIRFNTTGDLSEGSSITFTDNSSAFNDTILWREWDFGDGTPKVNTSTRTTSHTYAYSGSYQVNLRIQDNESAISSASQPVTVIDLLPTSRFTCDNTAIAENGTIRFSDVSTTYPLDHLVKWNWTFDDGTFSEENSPDHVFIWPGHYNVALRVMCNDSTDWSIPFNVTIEVADIPPASDFIMSSGNWFEGNNTIQFSDRSTFYFRDPITHWYWDFGDGTKSNEENPTHTYQWAGTYSVSLKVGAADGIDSTVTTSPVIIKQAIPTASIQVITPRPYVVGDSVTFQSTSFANPDHIVRLLWESDGETGDQNVFKHQFNANSNFFVKLTVWSNDSIVGISTIVHVDLEPSGVSIGTIGGLTSYPEDTTVTFSVTATPSPTDPISYYVWDLSSGSGFTPQVQRTEGSISWHFNQSGLYTIKVRVYDSDGYTPAPSLQISITEVTPVPSFTCGNLNSDGPVWFNANQTYDTPSDAESLRFRWNFGDQSPWSDWSSEATISHPYAIDGNYTVILQVKDDSGPIVSLSRLIVVDRSPPSIGVSSPTVSAYFGEPILVYVEVSDNIAVYNVTMIYTIGDVTHRVNMTLIDGGSYFAEIPAQNSSVNNITYEFTALDVSGMHSLPSQKFQIIVSDRPNLEWFALVAALIILVGLLVYAFITKPVVDEVFVIYQDGSLLSHDTRHLKPGMDDQILGSMLIALQSFVKDSFKDESLTELKRMEFGEKRILVEREGPIFLAVILRGKRDGKASNRMKSSLDDINQRFGAALNPWDGDLEKVRGVRDSVEPLVKRTLPFRKK